MRPSDCAAAKINLQINENEFIAGLDPLCADDLLPVIPQLNNHRNVNALIELANQILPCEADVRSWDYYEANAATRDMGFLLGSIKRHCVEPCTVIPNLGLMMTMLSEKTFLPPRDTLLHYTVWNPPGNRRRTYTGTTDEQSLIDSVVMATGPLVKAIYLLAELHRIPIQSTAFKAVCDRINIHFQKVIDGIVFARRHVSLTYFSKELRLYFDPVTIGDREYLGPGAVEMPMFVLDHLLWSSQCVDDEYNIFKKTYVPYIHWEMREIYQQFENKPNLIDKSIDTIITKGIAFDPVVCESMKGLYSIMQQLKSFRMPHKRVAEEAYIHLVAGRNNAVCPLQSDRSELRSNGSGGYSPGILSHILKLSNQKMERLGGYVSPHPKSGLCHVLSGNASR